MTAEERLQGPRWKMRRSYDHVEELRAGIEDYWKQEPYETTHNYERSTGEHRVDIKVKRPIHPYIGTIIGDAVHNMRSALDLLTHQLVEAAGGQPGPGTAFPIFRPRRVPSAAELKSLVNGKLEGADPEVCVLVAASQPYKGGNGDHIWLVNELDVIDKHRLLMLASSTAETFHLDTRAAISRRSAKREPDGAASAPEFPVISIPLHPAKKKIGDQGFTYTWSTTGTDNLDAQHKFTIDVSLDEPTLSILEPIVPLLTNLGKAFEGTIEAFAPYL